MCFVRPEQSDLHDQVESSNAITTTAQRPGLVELAIEALITDILIAVGEELRAKLDELKTAQEADNANKFEGKKYLLVRPSTSSHVRRFFSNPRKNCLENEK